MIASVRRAARLEGQVSLPGDKSISHRALILGALAKGESRLRGLSGADDVASTASCLRALGVDVDDAAIRGAGLRGLRAAKASLDCGNSGTTMRLLAGVLAAQDFATVLVGDESLSKRPMDRVVAPLREMGARADWPPLVVGGRLPLQGIVHRPAVPSAQVKSAVLLAGLFAGGATTVIEPAQTRNHTEVMLRAMGADVSVTGNGVEVRASSLEPIDVDVPGDVSAAAFWLVAAGLVPGSHVRVPQTGINPTRTAFVELLRRAGFQVSTSNERSSAGEAVADIEAAAATEVRPVTVSGDMAAEMIDELPVLAVAATQALGTSRIAGAAELRVKESDRIGAMAKGLASMGADIVANDDGWTVTGPCPLDGARVQSGGDHRVAMALAVAGLIAGGVTEIEDAECVSISYPGFFEQLESLC